jgi:hypothetical protein
VTGPVAFRGERDAPAVADAVGFVVEDWGVSTGITWIMGDFVDGDRL